MFIYRFLESKSVRTAIALCPLAIMLIYGFLLYHPGTEHLALSLLGENQPIELLTFVGLFAAGCCGVVATWKAMSHGVPRLHSIFLVLFTAWAFFTAMEEIAWGQWFFHYPTPDFFATYNQQGEVTLHNIGPLHARSEIFRVAFGLGGLLGVYCNRYPILQPIAPPLVLLPWFIVILIGALPDLYLDFHTFSDYVSWFLNRLSELVEMMIGLVAILYIFLITEPVLAPGPGVLPLLSRGPRQTQPTHRR